MPMQSHDPFVLDLDDITHFFADRKADPFSPVAVNVLGESGVQHLQNQFGWQWPRRPRFTQVTLRLRDREAASPDATDTVRRALRHYCAVQIARLTDERRATMRLALRQLLIALVILALDVVLIIWLVVAAHALLPGFLRGVLVVVALFAGSIAFWDALEALLFDWAPFVRDINALRWMSTLDIAVAVAFNKETPDAR